MLYSVAEPTDGEILRAVTDVQRSLGELACPLEVLRFEMTQQFGAVSNHISAVENRVAALHTRLGALEDRVAMQGITIRAIWDQLSGGGEHAA